MYIHMISCYILSLISFVLIVIQYFQSLLGFSILNANALTFMVLTSSVYFFTETLTIFYFVSTGVSVKEYTQANNADKQYHERTKFIKKKLFPGLMMNITFMFVIFLLSVAVYRGSFPKWLYAILYGAAILHYLKVKIKQNDFFRENVKIFVQMYGIKHQLAE